MTKTKSTPPAKGGRAWLLGPKPSPWAPSDADRCEASPVSYHATNGGPDAEPIAERCPRVWLVRVGGKRLCRSCTVLEAESHADR